MKKVCALVLATLLSSATLAQLGNPDIVGPVVSGKKEGEDTTSYIPYTKGDSSPVLATESFSMPRVGLVLGSPFSLAGVTGTQKLWVSKHDGAGGTMNSSMTLGPDSQYVLIGGVEYAPDSYRGIGFGFVRNSAKTAPVFVGAKDDLTSGDTNASLVLATRSGTDGDEAPKERLRIDPQGAILAADDYTPSYDQSLVTKKYTDNAISVLQKQIDALKKE